MKEVKDLKDRIFVIFFAAKSKGIIYNRIILVAIYVKFNISIADK